MRRVKIAILDYGIGNVKSICNALNNIGADTVLTADEKEILDADAAILPGVGAFAKGMQNLAESNLVNVIHKFVATGKPFMGICLGMQMLMDASEEFGTTKGLGLISGNVVKLTLVDGAKEKLPHVTWNEINEPSPQRWENTILDNIPKHSDVYFVHSFVAAPAIQEDVLVTAEYGNVNFCAGVKKGNIYGLQFHPEKSGNIGLQILRNFLSLNNQ